jgi:hypothetical protein
LSGQYNARSGEAIHLTATSFVVIYKAHMAKGGFVHDYWSMICDRLCGGDGGFEIILKVKQQI